MERLSRRKRVSLACVKCGDKFWTHSFRANTAKYCSKKCWSDRGQIRDCKVCGKPFKVQVGTRELHCSRDCYTSTLTGSGHPGWRGGSSLESERARSSSELKQWRVAVLARDGFECQRCGAKSVELHAHHILSFADHPDFRFDVTNGETLCVSCHGIEHGKDFTKRNRKVCVACGAQTSGRSKFSTCRSCGVKRSYEDGTLKLRKRSLPSKALPLGQ